MPKLRVTSAALLSVCLAVAACAQWPTPGGSQQAGTGPRELLAQARRAVQEHQQEAAYAAVDQAQTVWNQRNAAWASNAFFSAEPAEARQMAFAKQAIQLQQWDFADYYIKTAMRGPLMVTP